MTKALRIAAWKVHYESNESRKLKELTWVKTPNGHDSLGYCEIISHPNGLAHYGAWNLILQVASKCPIRGLLVSGKNKIHDARSIALMTRTSEKIVAEAIPRLLAIRWLEEIELDKSAGISGEDPDTPGEDPEVSGLEERRGEERRREGEESPPAPPGTDFLIKALKAGGIRLHGDALEEWITLTTNECICEDDEEAGLAIKWLLGAAKRSGVEVKYARHVRDFIPDEDMRRYKDWKPWKRAKVPA